MTRALDDLKKEIDRGTRVISLNGLTSISAKAFVLARLREMTDNKFVVLAGTNRDLEQWLCDLEFFDSPAVGLPAFETNPYSGASPHAETQERRALALWQMAQGNAGLIVSTARSLIQKTIGREDVGELGASIELNAEHSPEMLMEKLLGVGYVREDPLNGPGQFSIRGGILDVWSPETDLPARIEFFGDTVDSIRTFDPDTQLSREKIGKILIAPMREFWATSDAFRQWAEMARERFSAGIYRRNLKDLTDLASDGESFPGWEFVMPLISPLGSVFEHFDDPILVIDEPVAIENELDVLYRDLEQRCAQLEEIGEIGLAPHELFLTADELRESLGERRQLEIRGLGRTVTQADEDIRSFEHSAPLFLFPKTDAEVELSSRSVRKFGGDLADFAATIRERRDDTHTILTPRTQGMAERLEEILREYQIVLDAGSIKPGALSTGFEIPELKLAAYTELEIFGEVMSEEASSPARTKSRRSKLGAFISDFRDLKPGDFVVHVDHGIGRFEGLQTISSQGADREFMLLIYSDDAKLFVPVERMDLVSRYSSGEGATPALDRLGGLGWQKTKAKAKRAMRDMADELLKLYAERKLVRGHAFPPDAPWQHEFEDAFPYDLTVDQASAIEEVKTDMETATPMDRLIIGDVGYGKTEVAMRAAFKAVMDGKQTAVLTPTTVLAYQHFETFKKRFAAFPVKVDLLSRFRTSKEQKTVAESAGKGEVDVLIGTHRILSNDVKLPDLGLVVVDEEQRFGVTHKEKLKQLKKKVDVLTLSATPIPRTLNMSLLGMRDMSVIETPPRDRLAINTQVVQFSENVIRSAIELELARHGQVFFIHNRVESIEAIAALIQKIVPNARIAIGHGQMNEKEMEDVMLAFVDHKYDILVATTIIENGIDIPRANTIIVNRADTYGLSQLYQLRGRVGRSNRRAYAYLLIPSELELTPIARRRLSAIREFSDLGAGFRLAALDLELRGAGNILGGQQSGHLDALGFDLYTKMLERTISELRGEQVADETSVSLNLGIDVSIPKDYIADTGQRLRTYKRISSADGEEALVQIHAEIEDRYGRIPHSLDNLFAYARLRRMAEQIGLISVDRAGDTVAIKLGENARVLPEKIMSFLAENEGASFSPSGILRVPDQLASPIETAIRALNAIKG